MGEVYRARDTVLARDVALKFLPEKFALEPERLTRFRREAQVLAALNHPNIAQIYGFERSGVDRCLVMELVDGETLAAKIARGPIPFDDAMKLLRQIAEALESAHEKGIIHLTSGITCMSSISRRIEHDACLTNLVYAIPQSR